MDRISNNEPMKEETTMKTDSELQRYVMDELAWEPSVDAAEIGVSVDSGIVMLSGTVRSYPEKWAAERAAERVKGVKAVTDEIVVRLPGDFHRSDSDIARAAVNALEWNASVPRDRVQVLVQNGWITLDGSVEFHYQKAEAERAVRSLLGVNGVIDRINVKPLVSPADVKSQIVKALERAAEVDAKTIFVETRNGKVTLRGHVKSWVEREEAERAAWGAPGISVVTNTIEIIELA
jgi:osmotically-inducible protein OsmY